MTMVILNITAIKVDGKITECTFVPCTSVMKRYKTSGNMIEKLKRKKNGKINFTFPNFLENTKNMIVY